MVSEEKFLPSIADVSKAYHLDLNYNKRRGTMIQLEDYLELKTSSFYLSSGQGEGRISLSENYEWLRHGLLNTIASANFFLTTFLNFGSAQCFVNSWKQSWRMMTGNITEMPVKPKMVETCVKEQKWNSNMKLKWDELKVVVSCLEKVLSTVFLSCLLAVFVTIMCYYASHIKLKPLRSEFLDFRPW